MRAQSRSPTSPRLATMTGAISKTASGKTTRHSGIDANARAVPVHLRSSRRHGNRAFIFPQHLLCGSLLQSRFFADARHNHGIELAFAALEELLEPVGEFLVN